MKLGVRQLQRIDLKRGERFVVERIADGIARHRAMNDAQRVYLEVTTNCNLRCVTCVRNVWDDLIGEMSRSL